MAKKDKLIKRFIALPSDFHWEELVSLITQLGFIEMQGRGSRVKFYSAEKDRIVQLHKPHPAKIMKKYAMKEVLSILKQEKLL